MLKLSIIVPTYCEAENLAILAPRIHEATSSACIDYELIVVDDHSPDGIAPLCRQLCNTMPIRLIDRSGQRGLSSAVVQGMSSAAGRILLCMDADLSHPPDKIVDIVSALDDPSVDFVIGSRYIHGGSVEHGWSPLRRAESKLATWLARPLTRVKDPMAGYFALRRSEFLRVKTRLSPIGFKIGLELLVKTGAKHVVEVPISFRDRCHGQSKLTWREHCDYVQHLARLIVFHYSLPSIGRNGDI